MEEKRLFFLKAGIFAAVLWIFGGLLLWPDAPREEAPRPVVTRVEVNGGLLRREYTQPEKMELVLHYLRDAPERPMPYGIETPGEIRWDFALTLSDGSRRYYRQAGDGFLQKEGANWKTIDPQKALFLERLLGKVPSDAA